MLSGDLVGTDEAVKSYKRLFSRALMAAPERLHLAAHSHHLWPDASYEGHLRAWEDASRFADRKWEKVFEEIIPAAQRHIAHELGIPNACTLAFGANTHELLLRLFSAKNARGPLTILTSDGEFHSFRRQVTRWEEQGLVQRHIIPCEPFGSFTDRFLSAVAKTKPDIAFVSHVMYQTGLRFDGIDAIASCASPGGTWVIVDGYHAFMAFPTDLSRVADQVFYLGGGYKYAMAGEGAAFLHAPADFGARPGNTGWFAEFADIEANKSDVPYSKDGMRFMGATFDPSGLYRFNAVREMLLVEGLNTQAICSRVEALRGALEAAILSGQMGRLSEATILRPNLGGPHPRFVALRDSRAAAWSAMLLEHGIITDARGDVLRIGFGLYHDGTDISQLTEKLACLN